MKLHSDFEQVLKNLAISVFPREACALITNYRILPITNIATTKDKFIFSPVDFAKAALAISKTKGEVIVGIWHSHTKKDIPFLDIRTVSEEDMALYERTKTTLYISGYDGNIYYESVQFPKVLEPYLPLAGRPYILGVYDCATLLQDRFFSEYNIQINYTFSIEYLKSPSWQSAAKEVLEDNNFKLVSGKRLQKDDVLLVNTPNSNRSHAVLVLDNLQQVLTQREVSKIVDIEEYLIPGYLHYRHDTLFNKTEV